jgi:hypothetical protein
MTLSPVIMISLLVTWGRPGWYALASLFTAVAGLTIPATRWALRHRPTSIS